MFVEFIRTLRKFRGTILDWGIGLAAYSLLMVGVYNNIALIDFSGYLASFPDEMVVLFLLLSWYFFSNTGQRGYGGRRMEIEFTR